VVVAPLAVLELDGRPVSRRAWLADVWAHRGVLGMLSRADFQVRYKRASLGLLWAVAVPVLQSVILAVVFAKVIRVGNGRAFGAYVMSGVLAWSYFAGAVGAGATAIVDGTGLTDKVWFPRALLPLVPTLANAVGLLVSLVVLFVALPILGVGLTVRLFWLLPAVVLLITLAASLSLCLAALHVYFRDVRFLVQAGLLVWFYLTPIAYPRQLLGSRLGASLDFNPVTGVVVLFHQATVGGGGPMVRPLVVSVVVTIFLLVAAVEANRRHDRLFVDLL
jgi:ABC-type polysaccharide/polyol phosphate export permease